MYNIPETLLNSKHGYSYCSLKPGDREIIKKINMEMNITILFVNCTPMSRIFGEKVAMQWYQDNGFNVVSWDLSPIYHSKKRLEAYFSGSSDLRHQFDNHFVFDTKSAVKKALGNLPENTIIYHLSRISHTIGDDYWLLKLFKNLNLPYLVQQIENALVPVQEDAPSLSARIHYLASRLLNPGRWAKVMRSLFDVINFAIKERLKAKTNIYAHPSIAVGVGTAGRNAFTPMLAGGTEYVSVPSPSIDWNAVFGPESNEKPIILFVDESIGHAPDAKFSGFSTTNDLSGYYRNMDRLFTMLEQHLGLEVVIGASGKVQYDGNPFGEGRQLFYKKTLPLSSRAQLVLGHASSALYHCLCLNKPILLLDDPTFTEEKTGHVKTFASGVGLPYFNTIDVTQSDIEALKGQDNQALVNRLFCEPDVRGDYRQRIADTIIKFMENRANYSSDSCSQVGK